MDADTPTAMPPSGTAPTPCSNCGEPRPGRYCPACGQPQRPHVVSMRRMLADVIDDQLSINSALPRTLRALFTRPGFLTTEYVAGRIARYIAPFRLYLVSSILFFLVLSLVTVFRGPQAFVNIESTGDEAMAGPDRPTVVRVDDGTFFGIRVDSLGRSDTTVVLVNFGPRWISEIAAGRVQELSALPPDEIAGAMLPAIFARAPAGMFILLPVFAGMLKLVLIDKRRFYAEHFVFALHTHAFTFLVLTGVLAIGNEPLGGIAALGVAVYYFLAMRRFYRLSIAGTLLRAVPLFVAYQVLLLSVLLGLVGLALVLG